MARVVGAGGLREDGVRFGAGADIGAVANQAAECWRILALKCRDGQAGAHQTCLIRFCIVAHCGIAVCEIKIHLVVDEPTLFL